MRMTKKIQLLILLSRLIKAFHCSFPVQTISENDPWHFFGQRVEDNAPRQESSMTDGQTEKIFLYFVEFNKQMVVQSGMLYTVKKSQ